MKLKVVSGLLLSFLCLPGAMSAKSEMVVETPKDFAYGMPLIVEGSEPFYRVVLPEVVYRESVWPDMRDVRVFNNQGQAVPFAFQQNIITEESSNTLSLRVFPMKRKKVSTSEQDVIALKSANGVEITWPVSDAETPGNTYLLELPQQNKAYPNLAQIKLEWGKLRDNWQTRITLFYSDDLKEWHTSSDDVPLMDLTSGNDRLLLNTIDFDRVRARYFLLMFNDARTVPDLQITAAEGIVFSSKIERQKIRMRGEEKAISASEAEYTWKNPQLLSDILVRPSQENTVLPLEIEYRRSASERWLPLDKQVVYSINGRFSDPIVLNGLRVQGVRLKGVNQQWNDYLPVVIGERGTQSLIFNAQGSTPFLLAWGNKVAQAQAMTADVLISEALRKTQQFDDLPEAQLQPRIELGGVVRLSAVDISERAALWQKVVLWVFLLLGAGGLALLMLKTWKDIQQKAE